MSRLRLDDFRCTVSHIIMYCRSLEPTVCTPLIHEILRMTLKPHYFSSNMMRRIFILLYEVSSRCFKFVVYRLQRKTELCMPVGHVSVLVPSVCFQS